MLKGRRCRQNRGSFRRSFASRVGRGLAARRQAGGGRAPEERAILPSGSSASIRLLRSRRIPADAAGRYGDSAPPESFGRRAPPAPHLLERVASSDMLTSAYHTGISRGFQKFRVCGHVHPTPRCRDRDLPRSDRERIRTRSSETCSRASASFGRRLDLGTTARLRRSLGSSHPTNPAGRSVSPEQAHR